MHTDNVNFGASLRIFDAGKCFSHKQKAVLKSAAKKIGTRNDSIYISTRKYDSNELLGGSYISRKDLKFVAITNDGILDTHYSFSDVLNLMTKKTSLKHWNIKEKGFENLFHNTLYEQVIKTLEHFNDFSKNQKINVKEKSQYKNSIKKDIKEFTNLKRTYIKQNIFDKIKNFFKSITSEEGVKKEKVKTLKEVEIEQKNHDDLIFYLNTLFGVYE